MLSLEKRLVHNMTLAFALRCATVRKLAVPHAVFSAVA